jgi:hypothetical protein
LRLRRSVVGLALLAGCHTASSLNCARVPPDAGCTRVLFIGNSYTFANDLPGLFTSLARGMNRAVYDDMIAPGGATLADHARSAEVLEKIRTGHWTHVVLQEQSLLPAFSELREQQMYPAVRTLVDEIRRAGAQPVLFATWGRRTGWPARGITDYATMQVRVTEGYQTIAQELNLTVAPVGDAWAAVMAADPDIPLFQPDGSHPTVQGTFLAANVLAVTLFHDEPRGLGARGSVPEEQARRLQQAAVRAATRPASSGR